MKKAVFILGAICVIVFTFIYETNFSGIKTAIIPSSIDLVEKIKDGENSTDFPINVPKGYRLSIYNSDLTSPRVLASDRSGNLFVSDQKENTVYRLAGPKKQLLVSGLTNPHGIAFSCREDKCFIFIADRLGVYRFDYNENTFIASNKKTILKLNQTGRHTTKTLLVKEDHLFISVGSSCDTCLEKDSQRGTIIETDWEGGNTKIYASGLRNSVFMRLHPETKEIWATEMGRDFLGDNLPPDEINIIQEGLFYGWPYCYGDKVQDQSFDSSQNAKTICESSQSSHYNLQAHSAPLGLEFLDKNTLLVSYHGSWNRSEPTGYKVVKITLDNDGRVSKEEDFLTGWLKDGESLGRPVDILKIGEDIFISDDKAGVVYILQKI